MEFLEDDLLMKRVYRALLALCIILAMVFMLESCEKDRENQRLRANISNLDLENQKFKTLIDKKNNKISYQDQILLTQKEAIENGLIEIERLKNIKSKVKVVTETVVDTLFVPYTETVVDTVEKDVKYRNYFDYREPKGWYSLSGYASNLGLHVDSLKVKNEYSIYIADRKISLFKKAKPEVLLINKNPYTNTVNMSNVVIVVNKPFYKKNLFWAGIGLVGGVLISR